MEARTSKVYTSIYCAALSIIAKIPMDSLNYNQILPGRFFIGTAPAIIVMPPFKRPELPMPAITLPPISMAEEFASPQTRDPSSKIPKKVRYAHYPVVQVSHLFMLIHFRFGGSQTLLL